MSEEQPTVFCCGHIGIAGTTDVVVKRVGNKYEARVGICMMGATNMDLPDIERINDPFSPEWRDNYASGQGATEAEAIEALEQDQRDLAESIWR